MTPPDDDRLTAEFTSEVTAFANRITATIDEASLALLLSLGHQSGLFDALADHPEPATSAQIAATTGLNERYVREWLGGTAAAGVVDYDPTTSTYWLAPQRAAVLTRAAGSANLARVAQYIALLGEVEQKVLTCFHRGGGLAYSEYPRFHQVMAERSGEVFDTALVDVVLPLVPDMTSRLRSGADVADFGCGSGHAINVMAQAFPASRFTGLDFSAEGIHRATREAAQQGLGNATFDTCDLSTFDRTEVYDLVTAFDAIHDQAQPARVLANIYRCLRPGGVFLMADAKASSQLEDNIAVPTTTFRYTVSLMHCMPVSLALDGAGLGTVWGRQLAISMLADAGFTDVVCTEIDEDPANYYYIAAKACGGDKGVP